jgi:hypothetical protein
MCRGCVPCDRDAGMMAGVEDVRTSLEWLHPIAATAERRDDCENDGGLTHSAGRAGNEEPFH